MPRFARLIIETSGPTDPGPLLQNFTVGGDFYLRGLVTFVDCVGGAGNFDRMPQGLELARFSKLAGCAKKASWLGD